MSWDSVRKGIRTLENELEGLLTQYSKLAATNSTAYSSSGRLTEATQREYGQVEQQISQSLGRLTELVEQMSDLLDHDPTASTAMVHTATRHREILADYTRDFRRTQKSITDAESRANLLGSVREEIFAFRASTNPSAQDQLLSERGKIDSSHRMADDVLGMAYETRYEFSRQRSTIQGVSTRINGVLAQVPGINSVLGMINSRRRRDTFILGGIIAVCTLLLLWYVF
ncbi:uncharacterized protein L969DRAFT_93744 [Mixia osmundae IAM 14324]|uniref:Golgi SNAP receptor complex member 1 n=1 Tax=Mixia osmundae (strain CBS 9802 / IAM 14324 / JCM 22182 / KY 12970) TaxID=764103 RepID=G7E9G1_MIXOS|nr:uncharacterized protein L969DRAFT_93744 [Mixia osmundae IAM 14324]KEI39913.1 hypothetical protein L969DRAFT_93744 [Mixia osmundae IAM 14324]GAA99280.1 hypothetical protein E5Q_05975 [Mixia osmundae IAM 14324]